MYNRIHLGYYKTAEEAAQAYNIAANTIQGDTAKLNDVPLPTEELKERVIARLNKSGGFIMTKNEENAL
jgi:hypothetical protein